MTAGLRVMKQVTSKRAQVMTAKKRKSIKEVPLPFSNGLLSAKLFEVNSRFVVTVTELGLSCWGKSESEASFRLFTTLIKYFRQLNAHQDKLNDKALLHLSILREWMNGIEEHMREPQPRKLVLVGRPHAKGS